MAGKTVILGSTAQFGKKSQTGFLPQFKVWKTKESCMYLRLSKKGFAFFDKRIAVCRAHDLYAFGVQIAHLQPDRYFLSGTRPDRK